jgi:CheY-like chemotaxis protein
VREITGQMLRQCGFAVAEAASGQAALDALEQDEDYELIVIDLAMPGLSGIETVARARRRWPGLRVLYMTGYADAAYTDPDTGGDTLLKKPFRLHELQGAVRDALERRPGAETTAASAADTASPPDETAIGG